MQGRPGRTPTWGVVRTTEIPTDQCVVHARPYARQLLLLLLLIWSMSLHTNLHSMLCLMIESRVNVPKGQGLPAAGSERVWLQPSHAIFNCYRFFGMRICDLVNQDVESYHGPRLLNITRLQVWGQNVVLLLASDVFLLLTLQASDVLELEIVFYLHVRSSWSWSWRASFRWDCKAFERESFYIWSIKHRLITELVCKLWDKSNDPN